MSTIKLIDLSCFLTGSFLIGLISFPTAYWSPSVRSAKTVSSFFCLAGFTLQLPFDKQLPLLCDGNHIYSFSGPKGDRAMAQSVSGRCLTAVSRVHSDIGPGLFSKYFGLSLPVSTHQYFILIKLPINWFNL